MKTPILLLIASAFALACAGSEPGSPGADDRTVVRVKDGGSILPRAARVASGGEIAWLNESTIYTVAVFLSDEVVAELGCEQMRPTFYAVADGYRSEPLSNRGESTTLPCPVPAGTFPYRVDYFDSAVLRVPGVAGGVGEQLANPYRSEKAEFRGE